MNMFNGKRYQDLGDGGGADAFSPFERTGTTISPKNSGDNLNMGTGDVTATNAHFTGKLTVDGAIDPTMLVLDPQAVAPGTDPGIMYYNDVSSTFLFREGSSWHGLEKVNLTDEQQVYSIGVEGLNTNSGLNVDEKMDQPATAVTAINTLRGGAWTPSAAEAVTIDCRDSGTYGLISIKDTVTQYINVNMESARCVDNTAVAAVGLTDNTYVCCKEIISIIASGGSAAISKYAGSGSATVRAQLAQSSIGAYSNIGIEVLIGELISYVDHIVVNSGENGINLVNGTTLNHKGISCPYNITIGDNCIATIELDTLGVAADTGNISIGDDSIIFLKVHGNWAGYFSSIGTNTTINVIAGSRTATSNDSGASGVVRNKIVLGRDSDSTTHNPELYFESGGKLTITDTYIGRLNSVYFDTDTETTGFSYNGTCGIIRLNSATAQTLTFNQSPADVGIDWQNNGDFCYFVNVNTAAWTIAAGTSVTLKSNTNLDPIQPDETILVVRENKTTYHLFRSYGTGGPFQRISTTISPMIAGDDLNMGTGDVNAANVNVTGNYQISNNRVLAIDTDRSQLFVGDDAGINTQINGIAYRNTAIGAGALETNVQGGYNTAIGFYSLNVNANLSNNGENTSVGALCLGKATGQNNTAMGSHTGGNQDGGNNNVFIGSYAGLSGSGPTTYAKSNNTMIGYGSGEQTLTGSGNVFLGCFSGQNETGSNKLYIENSNSASPLIYGEFDTNLVKINGIFQSTGNVTIGAGAAGVDYTLTFDGETNDGVITWLEDEDAFDLSCGFSLNAGQIVTELSIDGTLAGDSDAAIPTEKAVKTYVDALSSVDKPNYETLSIGTGSLTATSSYLYLHSASVKTVFLPNATTLVNGQAFIISNNGTYDTPILLSDSSTLLTLNTGETIRIVCIDNGTTNGSWNIIDTIASGTSPFQRISTTISPVAAGDDLDMGSGDITTTGEIVGGDLTITSSTPVLKFNDTDDDVYIIITDGGDDLHFYNNVSGHNAVYKFFTSSGDGTDYIAMQLFGIGTSASQSNKEALNIEYNNNIFSIYTEASGSGTDRDLQISTAGDSPQLLLEVGGKVSTAGIFEAKGGLKTTVNATDVSNPPTDAQLDSAFGTPTSKGTGWTTYLDDNGAGTNFYQIVSDGNNWWVGTFTKAV